MYTYAAKVWDLSIVQGPFSVAPCPTLARYDSQLSHRRMCVCLSLYLPDGTGEVSLSPEI
jgi:hypothetical protein